MIPHCSTGVPGSPPPSPPLPWWWFLSCHQPMRIIPFLNSRSSPLPLRITEQPMRVSIGLVTHTQWRGGGQVLLVYGGRRMESNESHLSRINEVILIGNSTSVLLPTQSPSPSSPRGDPVSSSSAPDPFLQGFKLMNSL